jgi:hypothetical protein
VNVNLLIDSIVRQTTILIAQLATATGGRVPLAHTANQVFLDLVKELKAQGLGNKVIADMFGLALRTYFSKVQRLSESVTFRGRSLWEAVLDWVQERGTVSQSDVLRRFARDDEAIVRGVLSDLVDSGLAFRTGRGTGALYRAADPSETRAAAQAGGDGTANLVWLAVHRTGTASAAQIAETVSIDPAALGSVLEQLVREGRVSRIESGSSVLYRSDSCVIPMGDPAGWEAAVFDHFQAVVTSICTKLRVGQTLADAADSIGGSTYGFTIWKGHPHERDVLGLLGRFRSEAGDLRAKVRDYNAAHETPDGSGIGVIAYVGQNVKMPDDDGDGERT